MPIPPPTGMTSVGTRPFRTVSVLFMDRIDPATGRWLPVRQECIEIPPSLDRPNLLVVRMADSSMEPVIKRNAYVGVDRDNDLARVNDAYAVDVSGQGLRIKRLENNGAEPAPPLGGQDPGVGPGDDPGYAVVGKVVWVIQDI